MMIYHVCTRASAEAARAAGAYRAPSLATEGFIHMARRHQVAGVVQRYYAGQPDLVVLVVDPARLQVPVIDEAPSSRNLRPGVAPAAATERFPHVYGPIAAEAIVAVIDLADLPP